MPEKILVTYSTRTGSTKGVAEAIGNTLSQMGENVDVIPMQEVMDLSVYKAVIAGSAIQAGNWLPEAVEFVTRNMDSLSQRPFATFLVCMTLAMRKGESYRETVSGWLTPVRRLVTPVNEGLFKGILDIKKLPTFSDKLKFRISVWFKVWKEGDHREWDEIHKWALETKAKIDNKLSRNSFN